jgi:hypothetical protein
MILVGPAFGLLVRTGFSAGDILGHPLLLVVAGEDLPDLRDSYPSVDVVVDGNGGSETAGPEAASHF